jgi:aspartyl protease family protein
MGRSNWLWLLAAGLGVTVLVVYLFQRFPDAIHSGNAPNLVTGLIWLSLLGGSAVLHFRARPGTALRQAAAWIGIGLLAVIAYSYRDEFADLRARLSGELLPAQGRVIGEDGIEFRAEDDGHFHLEALVNGERVLFMVDTGASDVVLAPDDARRIGFDPATLAFNQPYNTANGVAFGASITLDEIGSGRSASPTSAPRSTRRRWTGRYSA